MLKIFLPPSYIDQNPSKSLISEPRDLTQEYFSRILNISHNGELGALANLYTKQLLK